MKFIRLGTRPDTFYTGEATRTMISDIPSDLAIHINNIKYLLHKFPLVQKCGLLQQLCSQMGDTVSVVLELHDVPGGADAFELCAKFCYGIKIDLGAHNFVPAICAANFLQMTESIVNANFVSKLEVFFNSCILQGWKDSVVALQATESFPEWSESLGIVRACINSIVDKILTHPQKVTWSYTYTRPGYAQKKHHKSAPKDWWTEDITDLNVDLFRCVINTVKSTNMFPPQLIGESLHVYVCRWLTPETSTSTTSQITQEEQSLNRKKLLEIIVNLIPEDKGSVSVGFLLRLLSISNRLGASIGVHAHLIKKCCLQLEEATLKDFMLLDIEMVETVLESFITQWRKIYSREEHSLDLIINIGKLVDSYLQIVSSNENMSVQKVVSLASALPEFARPEHDNLYKAINVYLNEHPLMSKEEKKFLCSILDCHKLSKEACAHAMKNERLPLRTVVQVLLFKHEKHGGKSTTSQKSQLPQRLKGESAKLKSGPSSTSLKFEPESEQKSDKVGEIMEEGNKNDIINIRIQRSKSEHGGRKGK